MIMPRLYVHDHSTHRHGGEAPELAITEASQYLTDESIRLLAFPGLKVYRLVALYKGAKLLDGA